MKISFAMINCNRRDGSARAVNEVAERLAASHEVHLYARKAEDLDLEKVRWHPVSGPKWPEVADFASYHKAVNRRLQGHEYDIVHSIGCNTLQANVITIQNIQPAKEKILKRLGREENISPPRRFTRWLYLRATCHAENQLYSKQPGKVAPMFLPVSRGVEKELRAHYDIGDAQVRIVPNAADTERFKPLSAGARSAWRKANQVGEDDLMLLFAGGEWARKGLDFAIRALRLVADPKVKLFVAGDDADRERFVHMAVEAGCQNRVIFGGFRKDMPDVMGAADLFLFPSWYEAFSLATLEAAACGLPVVATRINGTEDFIEPGINGAFIEHDPIQIASVLRDLCRDRQCLAQMGIQARRIVEQNYTWDRVTAMTEDAYRAQLEVQRAAA